MGKSVRRFYYPDTDKCKHYSKCTKFSGKVICSLDRSLRNLGGGCPCKKFEYRLFERIKRALRERKRRIG